MFKVKAWVINPITAICTLMVACILVLTIAAVPAREQAGEAQAIEHSRQMKDYQLLLTDDGKYVIMYDGDRLVTALPLDNHCNLTNAILRDSD